MHRDWAVSLGPTAGMPVAESPAKFAFDVNAAPSCANDFAVFPVAAAAAAGAQANIVALNNLYSGSGGPLCAMANPTFFWSYAVGTGPATGSPALSLDGKKVVFLENGSNVLFHVLTWVAGQGSNATNGAVAPGAGGSSVTSLDYTASAAPGCAASPAKSTYSSPFLDYTGGLAYVTADNGILYRIKNVFSGTPAVDYCITVSAGTKLTAPVYDPVSGKVFVSDGQSIYGFKPGAGSFTASGQIQVAGTAGSIVRPVTVDVSFGFVYAFSSHNVANTNAIVSQMPVSLASKVDAAIGPVPTGAAPKNAIYEGAFDNAYFASGPSAGSLYACGTQASAAAKRALYRITFGVSGTMNAAPAMSDDTNLDSGSTPAGTCSPASEFFDGTKDRLFVGMGGQAGVAIDQTVSVDHNPGGTTVTTAAFSTTAGNELLLAFISTDQISGGAGTATVTTVTGAGLTWALVKRADAQLGTAEIWRAFAPSALSSVTVTVTLNQVVAASMTVMTFTGIETSGFGGSNAIGASTAASAASGAPTASLVTTRDHSWVFGVGDDFDNGTPRTLGPNQVMIHEYQSSVNDDYWVQRRSAPTPVSGTSVTINDTAPIADRFNLAIVEILPALAADRMAMWDITSPIVSNATTATAIAPNEIGGTSGAIVDNNSASSQAASVYFGTLDTGAAAPCGAGLFCAVKLTQAGLQ
ncbi:MAG: hypothetical protein LAN37_14530 [Acidobacteriia bacterium]|nr:hypothetical protein [Terriglobia bacterium]